ncbi:amino acid adenylation domain-containing protein [Streptomyces sp. NPDC002935]|uniref:amino acid adenylation domain-containing protein n=1 Tax=Streptomyces sp. NPDC002935 TaxID=3154545 RepID=UPI00339DFFC7
MSDHATMTDNATAVDTRTAHQEFWHRIADTHAPLALPDVWGDPHRPGERCRVTVPFDDLRGALDALSERAGVRLADTLFAAHLAVMGALTSDPAFHTGLWDDGPDPGGYGSVLPVPHARPTGDWLALVRATARHVSEAHDHAPQPPGCVPDATVLFAPAAAGPAVGDHALVVRAHDRHLDLNCRTDAVAPVWADLLATLYRSVLGAMAEDPRGDATESPLPGHVRQAVLDAGRAPGTDRPAATVAELFARQAVATPDAVAVLAGSRSTTYQELDARSARIAHRLQDLGVGPGSVVGVLLHRGEDLLPALLGVLRSGAAYVPLDPAVPGRRLAHILGETRAPLVLTHAALAARIPAKHPGATVVLDDENERAALAALPKTAPQQAAEGRSPAYVIYTSGSTGTPKGVVIEHDALTNLLWSFRQSLAGGHGTGQDTGPSTWLASTSVSFDISALELYLPLIHGGRVVLADDDEAKDPTALLALIDTRGVTHVQSTPSGWRLLLAAGFARPHITGLAGGEELPARVAAELRGRLAALVNVYGPTETTIWSAAWPVPHGVDRVALGQPVANTRLHVLDRSAQPVPPGVPGELHIGGDGLARGYFGRPALTAERFVPDPYGPPGTRLYRTGDLARRLPDGTLEFLGRIDTQVKVSGYRIELGEIQAALTAHPLVRDAVVVVREPTPGNKRIVAYVVPAGRIEESRLRRHLAALLPAYMIPASFVALQHIPLSISGKVDRAALPAPGPESDPQQHRPASPATSDNTDPVREYQA